MKALVFGNKKSLFSQIGAANLRDVFSDVELHMSNGSDSLPGLSRWWEGDYIFSLDSPWEIPSSLLSRAKLNTIGWYMAPPEISGNFAIYNGIKEFGVSSFLLSGKQFRGDVIDVKRFPVLEGETLNSLVSKSEVYLLESFYNIVGRIILNEPISTSPEAWNENEYSIDDFTELCTISSGMDSEEIDRRVRVTKSGDDEIHIFTEIGDRKFYFLDK
jgi:hypothetical protein